MNELAVFVWFRADPARDVECRAALDRLAARLHARFRVPARFGWRDEPKKNRRTWLEVWEPLRVDQQREFVDALAEEARALGFDSLAPEGRFVDVFRWDAPAGDAPCA